MRTRIGSLTCALALAGAAAWPPPALAQDDTSASQQAAPADPPAPGEPAEPADPRDLLLAEIDRLHGVVEDLRRQLAETRLDYAEARRELQELRLFIRDHESLGRDFEQYEQVKAAAERNARQEAAEAARRRHTAEQAERAQRREAARSQRRQQQAEFERLERYADAGFTPLGLDVFLGNASYFYHTADGAGTRARIDYDGRIGHYLRLHPYGGPRVDYSSMTISGSILNAADTVRDIGVALAFFDADGNQVGGEIVQINNARPDVPYPFTASVPMALDRPFASSTTYVLYADPSAPEAPGAAPPDAPAPPR